MRSLAIRALSLQRVWKITGIEYFKNKKEEEERKTWEEEEAFKFGRRRREKKKETDQERCKLMSHSWFNRYFNLQKKIKCNVWFKLLFYLRTKLQLKKRIKTRLFLRNNESLLFFLKMKQMVQINCMCWEIEEEKEEAFNFGRRRREKKKETDQERCKLISHSWFNRYFNLKRTQERRRNIWRGRRIETKWQLSDHYC